MEETQEKLQLELVQRIIHETWETFGGALGETALLNGVQMARKFNGIKLCREYEHQQPSS